MKCNQCSKARPALKRPKNGVALCKNCFYEVFENEVLETIQTHELFRAGDRIAVAASGGKDSTVLAHVLHTLNARHALGLDLVLLSVDEGIAGYRDDSLETVRTNQLEYDLPLKIVSYTELYGWSMDAIVRHVGLKNNCTFCGVFRRQALDRGAVLLGVDLIATGHNADDVAETVLMNVLRGDLPRLRRCTQLKSDGDGAVPRCKPLMFAYEKEIVLYAYFKRLTYFSTECTYAPQAYRGFARAFIKDVEAIRPSALLDVIRAGTAFAQQQRPDEAAVREGGPAKCPQCGYLSSGGLCKACLLLDGLNRGLPMLGVGSSRQARRRRERAAAEPAQAARSCCATSSSASSPCEKCLSVDVAILSQNLEQL